LITFPENIYIAIAVKIWGWLQSCHVDIHIDFRTLPVFSHNNQIFSIFKYLIEMPLFWKLPIFINRFFVSTNSFITQRMKRKVGTKKPYCIWNSGVSDELIKPTSLLIENLPPFPFKLFYLGSMSYHRGVKEIINALASAPDQLDNFIFCIIGGDGLEPMQQLVKQKNLGKIVQFLGAIAFDQVPKYLAKAHAFISPLPDHPWWEVSSPLKLFEYLSTGKPIILTDIAPHRDVVPHATPGIFWLKDLAPSSILSGITTVIKQYEKYSFGCQNRIDIAANYTWSNQSEKLSRFIRKEYPVFSVEMR
jgi:glycosyltransferase involved in cell wall biosynthesis